MATKGPKLWLTTSRIRIINVVTFLMLSAVAVASDGNSTRKCYWCGPIAEQVNRKEVAPPCETENSIVFTCQEGHNYCAIAASSPPYVESRFCSKVYQDECYPQYCNSTKKWRMTCACRGDLCNENITKRELDAFAKLPREVEAKESRVKRNTKGANLILPDTGKTIIITNISALSNDDKDSSSEHNDQATQVILHDQILSLQVIAKDVDVVTTASTTNESNEHDDDNDDVKIYKTGENKDSAQSTTVSDIKSDEVKEANKIEVPETTITGILLSKVVIGTTIVTNPKENTNTARPSEKLPTAEALRQDASSENDDNNTENTTVDFEPTEAGTSESDDNDANDDEADHHVTGEPGESDENSANTHTRHVLLLINGLLLQYIYNRK